MDEKGITYDITDIINKCGQEVRNVIWSYVKDEYAVEDIFQETCLKLFENIDNFEKKASIKTWFTRIAINSSKDYLKSAYCKKVVPVLEYDENVRTIDDVYEKIENDDDRQQLSQIIKKLPKNYQEIIVYVFYKEYSVVDASKELKIAEGTARSRLRRAKKMIREELETFKIS